MGANHDCRREIHRYGPLHRSILELTPSELFS